MAEESEVARKKRLAARREREREYREANRDKLREYHAAWKARNREKVRRTNRKMYEQRSRLVDSQTLAQKAAALRWSGLFAELVEERRREFIADSIDADFGNHAVVWFADEH